MFRLALDSSGEKTLLATEVIQAGKKQVVTCQGDKAEDLASLLDKHLKSLDLSIHRLSEILVGVGPGSFTGLRVSLAYAKALAYGKSIEIRPFSLLDVIRQTYIRKNCLEFKESTASLEEKTPVCCFLDGKQKKAFVSLTWANASCVELTDIENWLKEIRKKRPATQFIFYGAFDTQSHKILENELLENVRSEQPKILHWEKIISLDSAFNLPKDASYTSYKGQAIFSLTPNYLRPAVAQR